MLDTNLISELSKPRPNVGVQGWLAQQREDELFLSAATWAEVRRGIARLLPGGTRRRLVAWLNDGLAQRFAGRILPIDVAVADAWGEMLVLRERLGRRIEAMDGLIAATAHVHGLALVTRDLQDFASLGLELVCPWT